jgi:hypothetical protein
MAWLFIGRNTCTLSAEYLACSRLLINFEIFQSHYLAQSLASYGKVRALRNARIIFSPSSPASFSHSAFSVEKL